MSNEKRCPVRYLGWSVPSARGLRCTLDCGHEGRHGAMFDGSPLRWWTPEEKEAIRGRKHAGGKR